MCLQYDPETVNHLFSNWILDDTGSVLPLTLDQYWRRFHGRSDELARLARVAIRLTILGCSEADAERLVSIQRTIPGLHGMNYRTDMFHARVLRHEMR
jgi:hypothetical protein